MEGQPPPWFASLSPEAQQHLASLPAAVQQSVTSLIQGQSARITALEAQLADPSLSPSLPALSKVAKVSMPKEFSGKKSDTGIFLYRLDRSFTNMPHRYPTDDHKINEAINLLTGKALDFIRPYADIDDKDRPDWLRDWSKFKDAFRRQFQDPDIVDAKLKQLDDLKQTGSAKDYSNMFLSLAAYVPTMDDVVKRHRYFSGLKPRLQERILKPRDTALYPTFEDLVRDATELDQLQYGLSRTSPSTSVASRTSSSPASHPSAMPATARTSVTVPTSTTASVPSTQEPMDVDSVKIPKTEAEKAAQRAYRLANGLCTCCGDKGHFIKDCLKATRYRARQSSITGKDRIQ